MTRRSLPPTAAAAVLDEAFLAGQTAGDEALQGDLLTLFGAQCDRLLPVIRGHDRRAAADAAHTLKGSASAVGAGRVTAVADAIETALALRPGEAPAADLMTALGLEVAEVRRAIALRRGPA